MRGRYRLQWLGLFVLIVSLLLPLAPHGAVAQDDTGGVPPVTDADGDGTPDADDPTPDGEQDSDNIPDEADNCHTVDNADQTDSDGDGRGDACDETPFPVVDSDGDGIPDDQDATPYGESDADDIPDDQDNCATVDNVDQTDSDADGIGDACDETPNGDVVDSDADGTPDADDPTPNGEADTDNIPDDQDNCPEVDNPDQADTDGDGTGEACDETPDGEGVAAAGTTGDGFGTFDLDDEMFDKSVTHLNGEPLFGSTVLDAVPGDVLTYTFTIMGPLEEIEVIDQMLGGAVTSCPTTVAAGQAASCTATYTVTQADVDEGFVFNIAQLIALRSDTFEIVNLIVQEFVIITDDSRLTLAKDAGSELNGAIGYTYTVTNTGNVTIANVTIADDKIPSAAIDCDPTTAGAQATIASLAWDAAATCTALYAVTAADRQAGSVTNTATASGTFDGEAVVSPAVSKTVTVEREVPPAPALTLIKEASAPASPALGDTISYTLRATNTGNVALTNVRVVDTLLGLLPLVCDRTLPANLAVNETVTCTTTYRIGQADVNRGNVVNAASATGQFGTATVTAPTVSKTITIPQNPSLALTKAATARNGTPVSTPITDAALGDVITYTFVATSTGNVTLSGVSITDPLPGLSTLTCGSAVVPATLAPGATLTCTATYTIQQADVDAGTLTNTASASGHFGTATVGAPEASETITLPQHPALTLTKEATARNGNPVSGDITDADLGDVITYTLVATNTGNTTLTEVTIADGLDGASTPACDQTAPVTLAPTAILTCTVTYTIDQADADAGSVTNTASASGFLGTTTVTAPQASATVTILQDPALSLTKQVTRNGQPVTTARFGEVLTYTFIATNTGNVTLTGVAISDPLAGLTPLGCDRPAPVSLASGERLTCTATYTIGLPDEQRRQVANTATASGTFGSETVSAAPATVTVPVALPSVLELLVRLFSQLTRLGGRP